MVDFILCKHPPAQDAQGNFQWLQRSCSMCESAPAISLPPALELELCREFEIPQSVREKSRVLTSSRLWIHRVIALWDDLRWSEMIAFLATGHSWSPEVPVELNVISAVSGTSLVWGSCKAPCDNWEEEPSQTIHLTHESGASESEVIKSTSHVTQRRRYRPLSVLGLCWGLIPLKQNSIESRPPGWVLGSHRAETA